MSGLEALLLAGVEPDTSQWGCWLWAGGVTSVGYGLVRWEGRSEGVHRVAFRLWVGPIPADRPLVCHHCDTRPCIRPDHLFASTHAGNSADMVAKGRQRQPALTAAKVRLIRVRLAAGESHRSLAAAFGVSRGTIWSISHRRTWRHVAP